MSLSLGDNAEPGTLLRWRFQCAEPACCLPSLAFHPLCPCARICSAALVSPGVKAARCLMGPRSRKRNKTHRRCPRSKATPRPGLAGICGRLSQDAPRCHRPPSSSPACAGAGRARGLGRVREEAPVTFPGALAAPRPLAHRSSQKGPPARATQPRASPFRRCRLATASTLRLVQCPHALLGGDSGGWGGTLTQRVPITRDNDSLCDVEDTGRSVRRHHTAHACAGPGVNVLGTRKHHSRVDHGSLGARGGVTRTFAYLFRTG